MSRSLAVVMTVTFLIAMAAMPVAQGVLQKIRDEETGLLEVFRRAPTRENLKRYEDDLMEASYAREWVQPRVQALLTGVGGFGNSKGVLGRDGWVFYAPGIKYVAGPGFLDADGHAIRRKAALDDGDAEPHPDPRPAVMELHQALKKRGIRLVLFPVPDKSQLQPAELHGRGAARARASGDAGARPLAKNPDYDRFAAAMRAAGVAVFEAAPPQVRAGEVRYLVQDTHWTPQWMEEVAGALARFVEREAALSSPSLAPAPVRAWKVVPLPASRVGDLVDMLKLPEDQRLFAPQAVRIAQVQDETGAPWQPDDKGDVLLLGDSFTNIFTQGAMGWGEAAGLAPHLARALKRDVDVIAQNDAGAHATRKLLAQALAAGEDRLAGKRVVIWELTARELAVGDWKPYSYELGAADRE
jgi:alginate O-acetyltransferase complex protein AlgJ